MAIVSAATLNSTCTTFGRVFVLQTHCVTVATAPSASVSEKLICATPIRINRKFSDIVPVSPGNRTFRVDATSASVRYIAKRSGSADSQWATPSESMMRPGTIASAINSFARVGINKTPNRKKAEAPQAIAAWVTSDTVAWMESRTAPGEGPLPGAASDLARAVEAVKRAPAETKQHG